ncbi:uncharacterized protein LOC110692216 [Chenopodium quinoa]|uniref:uncharacterized protein LOC110692216 n=1 Tax=Chenopodium quinoa TaxID=63459 RepID=UPI000B78B740|nr:uncharacterized protein LOC110692216 [Chenopodium quinoa]
MNNFEYNEYESLELRVECPWSVDAPQFWRVFHVIEWVTKDWAEPFDLSDLVHAYKLQVTKNNRCTATLKRSHPPLVERAGKVNDRGWKSRYVFVDKESLGEDANWLRYGWRNREVDVGVATPGRKSLRRVEVVLSILKKDQNFVHPIVADNSGVDAEEEEEQEDSDNDMALGSQSEVSKKRKQTLSSDKDVRVLDTKPLQIRTLPRSKEIPPKAPKEHDYALKVPADFLSGDTMSSSLWPTVERLLFPAVAIGQNDSSGRSSVKLCHFSLISSGSFGDTNGLCTTITTVRGQLRTAEGEVAKLKKDLEERSK